MQKWYQLITCAEPVGALNRRSFLYPKAPYRGFLSLLMVLVILQVFCRSMARNGVKSTFFLQVFESFLQVFCRLLVRNVSD